VHEHTFTLLKQALIQAPVLALLDFSKQFQIETDASDCGVGAILMHSGHPLAFVSKPLGPRTKGLSTYEKEYLAILIAIDHWRAYLQLDEFIIFTDQKSLIHLGDQRLHTFWQKKVFTKLVGLQYKIIYKKGSDNRAVYALSRHPAPLLELSALSTCSPAWIQKVQEGYKMDSKAHELLSALAIAPDSIPHFTLKESILRYKNRIWLGNNETLQQQVLQALHCSAIGGHSGFLVTYRQLKQLFAWKGMKSTTHTFMQQCMVCQQAKPNRVKYPGLLAPLPVPEGPWQVISMDFKEGLPLSGSANCILVVVDKFSKYNHFIPLHHPFTAVVVAQTFLHNVYKLHGLPTAIISDQHRVFTSQFWQKTIQGS
jgi:hypothetical protein